MRHILVLMLFTTLSFAAEKSEGRKIAEKVDANNRGFGDETVHTTMYLISARGDTVVRKTVNMTLEREFSEDYSIIQFLDPPDIKGTGLLTYQNPAGDDQQWLYLPELRRVKKISSANKSGSFAGSEFAYEDITGNTLNKFTYEKTGDEEYEGIPCYILTKTPNYKNSGYTKIRMWVDKEQFLTHRMEYIDRKNSLLKVQTFGEWKEYGKGVWRPDQINMENLQTQKKSSLIFKDRKMNRGLKESDFTQRRLERLIH